MVPCLGIFKPLFLVVSPVVIAWKQFHCYINGTYNPIQVMVLGTDVVRLTVETTHVSPVFPVAGLAVASSADPAHQDTQV